MIHDLITRIDTTSGVTTCVMVQDAILVGFDVLNSLEDVLDVGMVSELPGAVLEKDALISRPHHETGPKKSSISLHVATDSFERGIQEGANHTPAQQT